MADTVVASSVFLMISDITICLLRHCNLCLTSHKPIFPGEAFYRINNLIFSRKLNKNLFFEENVIDGVSEFGNNNTTIQLFALFVGKNVH